MVRTHNPSLNHQMIHTHIPHDSSLFAYRHSSTKELKEGETVEFTVASFQHANGVIHIEGALA